MSREKRTLPTHFLSLLLPAQLDTIPRKPAEEGLSAPVNSILCCKTDISPASDGTVLGPNSPGYCPFVLKVKVVVIGNRSTQPAQEEVCFYLVPKEDYLMT